MNTTPHPSDPGAGAAPHRIILKYEEVKDYQHVPSYSDSKRLAHFADWMAARFPSVVMPYNIAFRAIFACARTPARDSQESRKIRQLIARAKRHLLTEYNRSIISTPGVGFRATESDEIALRVTVQQSGRRVVSAIRQHERERAIVNLAKVPKTVENMPYIQHFKDGTNLLAKTAADPKLLAAFVYEAPAARKAK